MFIIIPFSIVLVSTVAIGVILGRKLPYLQKVASQSHHIGPTLWDNFFPELNEKIQQIDPKAYKAAILLELEKIVRRMRLLLLTVDRLSETLIHKIRREHRRSQLVVAIPESQVSVKELPTTVEEVQILSAPVEDLKQEEQRLIGEIAKNPKDAVLYLELGKIYLRMNALHDARQSFETILKLEPGNRVAADKLAEALEKIHAAKDTKEEK